MRADLPLAPELCLNLPQLAALKISGPDAQAFLQSQLSSNVANLSTGQTQLSAWCAPNGRVRVLGWLFVNASGYWWFVAADTANDAMTGLNRFKLRAKVSVEVCQEIVCGTAEPSESEFRIPDGRELMLTKTDQRLSHDINALNAWLLRDIVNKIPWNGGREKFLPQMLNLQRFDGLSLKKGCFPGQEVIARLHYKGELKRDLRLLETSQPLPPGNYICSSEQDEIEVIQSQETTALAVVAKKFREQFYLDTPGVHCTCAPSD
jgi:tRNA-modifying protein YgfZ